MGQVMQALKAAFGRTVADLSDVELDERLRENGQAIAGIDAKRAALSPDADDQSRWRVGEELAKLERDRVALNQERVKRYLHPAPAERQETTEQRKTRETLEQVQV